MAPRPVSERFYRAAPRIKSSEVVPETIDANVALALLLAEPLLIRRPLMQCDERRMVGFNAALANTWIGLGAQAPAPDMPYEGCAAMTDHSSHQRAIRCAPST
ncbi:MULTISPECIES: ArsC/Spx/MgsR family protein [Paraburkholderia]|uniref:ArsC/Spx/MgsR family protein n=1 Tax=Paraburkholderia TaxID=1822464 RepID=UPI0028B04E10|nr:ArsC/Spx/MgsR family protein [Paraburkholderia podalyriae]